MPERIGFIGVGTMGKPMATNLIKAGHQRQRVRPESGRGGRVGRARALSWPGQPPRQSPVLTWRSRWCRRHRTSKRRFLALAVCWRASNPEQS